MSKGKSWFISYSWLLGFTGLFYFVFHAPFMLGFFGFFGFKWVMKYRYVEQDEIFKANSYKAFYYGVIVATFMIATCTFLFGRSITDSISIERKYYILMCVMCLASAVFFIVSGYLLDKFEKSSRKISQDALNTK